MSADAPDAPEEGAFLARDPLRHPPALAPGYKSSVLRSPRRPLLSLDNTLGEMTGPRFGHTPIGALDDDLVHNFAAPGESAIGQRIIVHGRVMDERGRGVAGALVEVWQANAGGRYRHARETYLAPLDPNFGGCGRVLSDAHGRYRFRTIQPGAYPWPNGVNDWRPTHIHFKVFGHDFAKRRVTQMYFEGDPLIPLCPIVATLADPRAVESLIAPLDMAENEPMDARAWRFDIELRGRRATRFENRREGDG